MKRLNPIVDAGQKTVYAIMGAVAIIAAIAALVAGAGILASLITILLICVVIYFGSIRELAGSVVVGCLLKAFVGEIQQFATVWWTGASASKFFDLVRSTGYFKIVAVVFFFVFALSLVLGSFQLVRVEAAPTAEKEKPESPNEPPQERP